MKYRNKRDTEYDHGQGQTKIILNKPHSVGIRLARGRKKSNGTCLRTDNTQAGSDTRMNCGSSENNCPGSFQTGSYIIHTG